MKIKVEALRKACLAVIDAHRAKAQKIYEKECQAAEDYTEKWYAEELPQWVEFHKELGKILRSKDKRVTYSKLPNVPARFNENFAKLPEQKEFGDTGWGLGAATSLLDFLDGIQEDVVSDHQLKSVGLTAGIGDLFREAAKIQRGLE